MALGLPQKSEVMLDRVSTGSGSDLVSDQQAIFPMMFDLQRSTRSLPLPVLTWSKSRFGLLKHSHGFEFLLSLLLG